MSLFSKKKEVLRSKAYIHIDGRSIGIVLCNLTEKGSKIVYAHRAIHIKGQNFRDIEMILRDSLYAIRHNQDGYVLSDIICIFDEPWVSEKITSVKEKRTKAFEVTDKFLDELAQKEFDRTNTKENTVLMSDYIVEHVTLNGYTYAHPVGKITEAAEVSLTAFTVDKSLGELVANIIKDIFPLAQQRVVIGNKLIIQNIKNKEQDSFVHVLLLSTQTIFRMYSKSIITEKVSNNYGYHEFIEQITGLWNMHSYEAENWLRAFMNKTLNQDEHTKIENDIRTVFINFNQSLIKDITDHNLFLLERPYYIQGSFDLWNNIFMYAIHNGFFGELIPHSEKLHIQIEPQTVQDTITVDAILNTYIDILEK